MEKILRRAPNPKKFVMQCSGNCVTTYVGSWYDAEDEVETSTDTKTYDGRTATIGWQNDGGYDSDFRDVGLW